MYWEEVTELIKTHGKDTESKYPNQYNDSDDYITYDYERGTVKTSYIHIDEFPEIIKDRLKKYLKYDLQDIQIFASLGPSEGIGIHDDFIKEGLLHMGVSSTVPRICISCAVKGIIPKEEVTYYT